ncbi:hypothetical protein BgiMline_033546 [Biomphalaria glabrata]
MFPVGWGHLQSVTCDGKQRPSPSDPRRTVVDVTSTSDYQQESRLCTYYNGTRLTQHVKEATFQPMYSPHTSNRGADGVLTRFGVLSSGRTHNFYKPNCT